MILLHLPRVEVNEAVSTVPRPITYDLAASHQHRPIGLFFHVGSCPIPSFQIPELIEDGAEFILVEVRQEQGRCVAALEDQTTRATAKMLFEFFNN